jgi:DNA-binding MarR family transcriptional regulator
VSDIPWLDGIEADAWRAVRDLGQPLWTALGRDLQRESGLSIADYEVLVVLSAEVDGLLAYRDLASATGWEKSRLSHHLTRMQQRGLVRREGCSEDARSANISLTTEGRRAIEQAAPGHVASVRRLLIDRLSADQLRTLAEIGRQVRPVLAEQSEVACRIERDCVTDSAVTETAVTETAVTDAAVTGSSVTEPAVTEPAVTDPALAERG